MSAELKPCPFCGSKNVSISRHKPTDSDYVACNDCTAHISDIGASRDEAIGAWNRRAQPAEEVQPVGEVSAHDEIGAPVVRWLSRQSPKIGTPLYTRPPAVDAETVRKAARYDYLRMRVCGIGSKGFDFVNLPPMPPNWARGSIAQHFDEAIDAAIAASKEQS